MSVYAPTNASGDVNLQSTIAAVTALTRDGTPIISPHHPVTCLAGIYFDEEGVLSCDHAKTEKGDARTQAALHHSVAILLLECAAATL